MPAPKGHAPYPGGGRPRKYDLVEEAQALEEWSKRDDSIYLGQFVLERDFDPDNLSRWAAADDSFADSLKKAKLRIAYRLRKRLNDNDYNAGLFHREIGMYDKLLRDFERSEKEQDVKMKIELEKETFVQGKSAMQEFLKTISPNQSS